MASENSNPGGDDFMSNVWGWKWSMVSLVIICLFLGLATCRYYMLKPDRLVVPENIEQDF